MLNQFPRLILKENRKALSMEDVKLFFSLAKKEKKLCLYGLYAFEKWKNENPIPESVILDCIALEGSEESLTKLGEKFFKDGKECLLLFDGEKNILFITHDGSPLENVKEPEGATIIRNIYFKFTYPNTQNGKTGEMSRIVKKWKN